MPCPCKIPATWAKSLFKCPRVAQGGMVMLGIDWYIIPARLQTWSKAFNLYFSIKHSRNKAFRHFLVGFIKSYHENNHCHKNFDLVFAIYFQVLWLCKVSLPSSGRKTSYQQSKFSAFLFLDQLKTCVNPILEKLVNQRSCYFYFLIETSQKFWKWNPFFRGGGGVNIRVRWFIPFLRGKFCDVISPKLDKLPDSNCATGMLWWLQ